MILGIKIKAVASGGGGFCEKNLFSDTGIVSFLLCFPLPDAWNVEVPDALKFVATTSVWQP